MVLGGSDRFRPVPRFRPVVSKDTVGRPFLSIGSTCEVVKKRGATWRAIWETIGSGEPTLFDHIWCRSLRRLFCCPSPGPGGSDQPEKTEVSVGLSAFGTWS